ncbi:MAG: hypothetical protein H6612_13040 [Ignavibacteriales bacterium]|nr:hypothetical protein [Ignavibacteriales bacterium]
MKKHFELFLSFLLLLSFISGCSEEDHITNNPIDLVDDYYNNTPVIVNTNDNFTFTISAKNFDYVTDNELIFNNADSIVVTITLTNASSNNSFFTLTDNNNKKLIDESLNTNKVIVRTDLGNVTPKKSLINLNDFTGKLTIVVANKK